MKNKSIKLDEEAMWHYRKYQKSIAFLKQTEERITLNTIDICKAMSDEELLAFDSAAFKKKKAEMFPENVAVAILPEYIENPKLFENTLRQAYPLKNKKEIKDMVSAGLDALKNHR